MRGGKVVRIRIAPADCQAILAILRKAGVDYKGMSFAGCVSLALTSSIATLRKAGAIEETDPFQFLNEMAPFEGKKVDSYRRAVSDTMYQGQAIGVPAPTINMPGLGIPAASLQQYPGMTPTDFARLDVLNEKGPLNAEEQEEYKMLERKMFG